MTLAVPAAAAALLIILVAEWLPGGEPVLAVPPPSPHTRGTASEADTVAKDTEGWAQTIVARPLFSLNRRPLKSLGGKNAVASTGLPRLSGIMISRAGKRAIFMPEGGRAQTLAEGASLDDYTIRQIWADHVVLHGAKGEMVLHPAYDGSLARAGGGPGEIGQPGIGQSGIGQPGIGQPGIGQPGFQPPGFNPAFRPPGFPAMQVPPAPPPNAPDEDNSDDASTPAPQPVAPQPFPGFRGPLIPRGRNNE